MLYEELETAARTDGRNMADDVLWFNDLPTDDPAPASDPQSGDVTDGSVDYSVMTEEDWVRLAQYSARQNRSNAANSLYGVDGNGVVNIDPGFLMAKCIKHAFKTYPKVRIGRGTELQSQQTEEREIEINDSLYGMQQEEQPAPTQDFCPEQQPAGVTVDTGEDDGF